MNIKVIHEEGTTQMLMSGTIDIPSAESLKKSLHAVLETEPKNVVLDFNEVESIGSSGIGALLLSHKEFTSRGITFDVININKEITALFRIIKLDKLFKID